MILLPKLLRSKEIGRSTYYRRGYMLADNLTLNSDLVRDHSVL